jgi:hypothetical protein
MIVCSHIPERKQFSSNCGVQFKGTALFDRVIGMVIAPILAKCYTIELSKKRKVAKQRLST